MLQAFQSASQIQRGKGMNKRKSILVAAIGLAGPVSRLSKKALSTYIPHVIETAAAISARLGHRVRAVG